MLFRRLRFSPALKILFISARHSRDICIYKRAGHRRDTCEQALPSPCLYEDVSNLFQAPMLQLPSSRPKNPRGLEGPGHFKCPKSKTFILRSSKLTTGPLSRSKSIEFLGVSRTAPGPASTLSSRSRLSAATATEVSCRDEIPISTWELGNGAVC